jgi:hypothetical protein
MGQMKVLPIAAIVTMVILSAGAPAAQAGQPPQPITDADKVWTWAMEARRPLQLTMDANDVWVRAGESPVLWYRCGGVPFKPYVKELYTPGGVNILLDAPPDHLHHHGLMFAVAANGVNYWEETPTAGRQTHRDFTPVEFSAHYEGPGIGYPIACFGEHAYWRSPSPWPPGVMLLELREMEVGRRLTPGTGAPATVLAWKSELSVPGGKRPVVLSGSHYFGLGLRFPRSMDGTGQFLNADGKEGTIFRGEERLVRSNWCAYQVTADGKPVTVAMFGYPSNPRGPTLWFTMAKPFAYMSATLGLHEEPLKVPAGWPLVLRYCVAAWDRHILPGQIDAFYDEWTAVSRWKLNHSPSQDANQTNRSQ